MRGPDQSVRCCNKRLSAAPTSASLFLIKGSREHPRKGLKSMQLKDIAVLVTGGGSGLGAATARAMAEKGAKVAVLAQSKENAEKIAAVGKAVAVPADVTDEDQVKAAIAKAEAVHGIARVLVNCAGIGGSPRTVRQDGRDPPAQVRP